MPAEKFPRYSGMDFIPDNAYVIEESPARLACTGHIRSVEFIRRKGTRLMFIEAKTTFANPENSPEPYKTEVTKVCEKFIHSLSLLSAIKTGVTDEALPAGFDYSGLVELVFVLVVKKHKAAWCRPIKREIEQMLPIHVKKIWKPSVYVLNYEMAKEKKYC
jgi:hypothetical protein